MPEPSVLLVLAFAAIAAFALLEAMIRRSMVGVGVVLATFVIHATVAHPDWWVGATRIAVWDMTATLLFCAAVARLLRARGFSSLHWLLICFGLVVLLCLVRGVVAYGVNTAVNEFRSYFGFLSTALYVSTIQPQRRLLDWVSRAWVMLAGALVLLAVVRWAAQAAGLSGSVFGPSTFRVLDAGMTLLILQGFVIGTLAWARSDAPTWIRGLTPALLAVVVIMQHRTVWVVLLASIAVAVLVDRRAGHKLLPVMVLGLVLVAALSSMVLEQDTTELVDQLGASAEERRTWEWRVEGWGAVIEQSGPQYPMEFMFGRPFGAGWDRVMGGRLVTVSPHNYYVQTYLRTGLVGLALVFTLYVSLLWRLGTAYDSGGLLARRTLFLLLLGHPIFFIPYTPAQEQGVILGLAVAIAIAVPEPAAREPSSVSGGSTG